MLLAPADIKAPQFYSLEHLAVACHATSLNAGTATHSRHLRPSEQSALSVRKLNGTVGRHGVKVQHLCSLLSTGHCPPWQETGIKYINLRQHACLVPVDPLQRQLLALKLNYDDQRNGDLLVSGRNPREHESHLRGITSTSNITRLALSSMIWPDTLLVDDIVLQRNMFGASLPAVIAYARTISYQCLFCGAVRGKSNGLLGFMHGSMQGHAHAVRQLLLTSWSCVNSKTISSTTAELATILLTGVVLVSSAEVVGKEGVSGIAGAMQWTRQVDSASVPVELCLQQEHLMDFGCFNKVRGRSMQSSTVAPGNAGMKLSE